MRWEVLYNNEFIGTVYGPTEDIARCAAYAMYEPLDEQGHGTWDMDLLEVREL